MAEDTSSQLDILRAHAAGQLGTRAAIERAGMHDCAERVIGLARNGLEPGKPGAIPPSAIRGAAMIRKSAMQ